MEEPEKTLTEEKRRREGVMVALERRQLWIAGIALAVTLIGGGIVFTVWLANLQSAVNGLSTSQATQDTIIKENKADVLMLSTEVVRLNDDQRETEEQFCAADVARNLTHANDLRDYAVLWEKVMGTNFPAGTTYFPTLCNRTAPIQR